jgi:hypothetical protein
MKQPAAWGTSSSFPMNKSEFLEIRAFANAEVSIGFFSSAKVIVPEAIANVFVEMARDTPLQMFAVAKPAKFSEGDGFQVTLHPNAPQLVVYAERYLVHFHAITSFAGPGYHAFVIAALDAVQAEFGLKWNFMGREDDNTGYVRTRDFPGLQRAMAHFFRNRCRQVVEWRGRPRSAGTPEAYLGLSPAYGFEAGKNEVLTPFGPRSFEEVEHWSTLDGDPLMDAAADFFLWWGQGFDGAFFRGYALSFMWQRLRWAKPIEPFEGRILVAVLSALHEAMQRGVRLPVSLSVVSEIMALVGPDASVFPHPTGIGYRRRNSSATLNGWSLQFPGSLRVETSQPQIFAATNGVFRVQMSYGIQNPGANPGGKALAPGEVEKGLGFLSAEDGKGFVLDVVARTPSVRGPDRLCLVKIWMADGKWRNIAEAIADSVTLSK